MLLLYFKRIFCFPLPNSSNKPNEHIAHLLLTAFAIYSRRRFLFWRDGFRCAVLQGPTIRSKTRLTKSIYWSYAELIPPHHSYTPNSSVPCPNLSIFEMARSMQAAYEPLPSTAAFLLVVSIIHTVCDGRGVLAVLKIIADKFRKVHIGELTSRLIVHEESVKQTYSLDRAVMSIGNGLPDVIENHLGWTVSPLTFRGGSGSLKTLCIIFHMNGDSLLALKKTASLLSPSSSAFGAISKSHPKNGQQFTLPTKLPAYRPMTPSPH